MGGKGLQARAQYVVGRKLVLQALTPNEEEISKPCLKTFLGFRGENILEKNIYLVILIVVQVLDLIDVLILMKHQNLAKNLSIMLTQLVISMT